MIEENKDLSKTEAEGSLLVTGNNDEEMTSPEVAGEPNKFNYKKFILGLVIGLVVMFIVVFAVCSNLFYHHPNDYPLLGKLALKLNLPIASVSGQFINYDDFYNDYTTIKFFNQKQLEKGLTTQSQVEPDNVVQKSTLDRIIERVLMEQLAKKYNIVVNNTDIEAKWQSKVVPGFGGQDVVAKNIKDSTNMSVDEYKERVVKLVVLSDKLSEAISLDSSLQDPVKQKAEKVLEEVKAGQKDFATLADEYTEDPGNTDAQGKKLGGELPWFSQGQMITEFETPAFALKPGEVSDLIETQYGYHIIKMEEKKAASKDGKTPEQIRVRHILILKPTINTYLDQKMKDSEGIKKYISL